MDKYTYANVIIDPNDPRVKVGAEYYWGESPRDIIRRSGSDNRRGSKVYD